MMKSISQYKGDNRILFEMLFNCRYSGPMTRKSTVVVCRTLEKYTFGVILVINRTDLKKKKHILK